MSSVKWTKDQQRVIDLRHCNILVSAAAGSGKTAVLVERIITMITEGDNPIDIDKLLIVTFTNAAAAEMKERIGKAIEKKLAEMPDNTHLQKQMSLLHTAQITTIHSFCLSVIRDNFNMIDLDPSFRIGDETELQLLQSDVIGELLEEKYEEASDDFVNLVECYASGKTDTQIEKLILELYRFSISDPWPEEWLNERKAMFDIHSVEELENADWMKKLLLDIKTVLRDLNRNLNTALDICSMEHGPYYYKEVIEKEDDMLSSLLTKDTYYELYTAFEDVKWGRLPGKRDKDVDNSLKEKAKSIRDGIKKSINDMNNQFFFQSPEGMVEDIEGVKETMNTLLSLTVEFGERYRAAKEDRGIIDFNDIEHFALNILVEKNEEGQVVPTAAADTLSEYYEEILIDEYQDSNYVQEAILTSVSKERFGKPNVFMVGDVKQSIYKFRMARPELFNEKYNTYEINTDSLYQRIDLHQNFRSRDEVLTPINYIFKKIMTKQLGDIEYSDEVALHVGRTFEETEENRSTDSELILVGEAEKVEENGKKDQAIGEFTERELEAKAVAKRIKELVNPETGLWIDGGEKGYRLAGYKDIVILFRTMAGWSDVFTDVLMQEGIPAFAETQTGYFSAIEVQTVLNYLKIIDNPRQEIPLTAILHSPIYDVTTEELGKIKIDKQKQEIYDSIFDYIENGEDQVLITKLQAFLKDLEHYRKLVFYTPIYELIERIMTETGYAQYVLAMPAGDTRTANIDMLVQKAIDFEKSSFTGLFDFNRYIEKLQKYNVDFGEASMSNENDDVVRIMSIHKSKGLEFPIVIVAGMGKQFNNQDARSKVVLHPDYGIGPDYIDPESRLKSPTLLKKMMARQVVLENLGEELRVLYVALTRAKEKLIMIGYEKKLADQIKKWINAHAIELDSPLSYQSLASASDYFSWVIPACLLHPSFQKLLHEYAEEPMQQEMIESDVPMSVRIIDTYSLVEAAVLQNVERQMKKEELLNWDTKEVYDENLRTDLEKELSYEYPYVKDQKIHSKVTVSELKRMGQNIDNEESVKLYDDFTFAYEDVEYDEIIPEFIKQEDNVEETIYKASDIGTMYHSVLEHADFEKIHTVEDVKAQLELMVEQQVLTKEELPLINAKKIFTFVDSDVAKRMTKAKNAMRLYREQQFVMGQPANTVNPEFQSTEMVLVQGIIDVYFEEDDGLVLLDYKTDRVNSAKVLVKRYAIQLEYYKKALEQITHQKVKEIYIYSFALEKLIKL